MHTLDAMVVSVIECRIADFIEAILFPSMLPFLRLDFSRCPAITNGRETDRLEFYHLNVNLLLQNYSLQLSTMLFYFELNHCNNFKGL